MFRSNLRSLFFIITITLCISSRAQSTTSRKEILHFHIRYAWFTIGKGFLEVERTKIKGVDKTHVFVTGKTSGLLGAFKPYNSVYESYIDPVSFLTDSSYSFSQEGDRLYKQKDRFFRNKDTLTVNSIKNDTSRQFRRFPLTNSPIYDALGAFIYLRKLSLDNIQTGDSIMLNVFYSKRLYPFGVEYIGQEEIGVGGKNLNSHEFFLLFPLSSTFPEPHMVKIWVSDDATHTPLLAKLKLKFGQVTLLKVDEP